VYRNHHENEWALQASVRLLNKRVSKNLVPLPNDLVFTDSAWIAFVLSSRASRSTVSGSLLDWYP